MTCKCLAAFVVACSAIANSQDFLPEKAVVRLYPDNFGGRRGHQVDLSNIATNGKTVSARITMYGPGQDGCRLQNQLAEGTFDGANFRIGAKIDPGDRTTCPMKFDLKRTDDGRFDGRFANGQFGGDAKPE